MKLIIVVNDIIPRLKKLLIELQPNLTVALCSTLKSSDDMENDVDDDVDDDVIEIDAGRVAWEGEDKSWAITTLSLCGHWDVPLWVITHSSMPWWP